MKFYLIVLFLLEYSSILFANYFIAYPDSLVGYRFWKNSQANIVIKDDPPALNSLFEATLYLKAPGASEMKISNYADFRGSEWVKYVEKKTKWVMRNEQIVTVYVVFKRYNLTNKRWEISPIVHYSLDKNEAKRKIIRTQHGYIDWTKGTLFVQAFDKVFNASKRYNLTFSLQKASIKANDYAFNNLSEIFIYPFFTIKDYYNIKPNKGVELKEYLNKNIEVVNITYPSKQSAQITKKLNFFSQDPSLLDQVKKAMKTSQLKKFKSTQNFKLNQFSALVLDLREANFLPSLMIKIVGSNEEEIFNISLHNKKKLPFVQYIRSLKDFNLNQDNILFIKAYRIEKNGNIVISNRYKNILFENIRYLKTIANGNLYLLID